MDIKGDEVTDKSAFILRVARYSPTQERPLITRNVEMDISKQVTKVTIEIKNPTRSYKLLQIVEDIDKQIAKSSEDINFADKPTAVISKDPKVQWNIKDIKAGETRKIVYSASGIPPFSKLVFWPFDELSFIREKFPSGLKIVDVSVPTLYQGRDKVKITVENEDADAHTLRISPEMPERWAISPTQTEEVLQPKQRREYILAIDPDGAAAGKYIIKVIFDWDGEEIVREYSVTNKSFIDRVVDFIVSIGNYLKSVLGL